MRSSKPGRGISASVENITPHGIWVHVLGREHFLDYRTFPHFRGQPQAAVKNVRLLHQRHLHWPVLDVDLEIDNLVNPQRYPLKWVEASAQHPVALKVSEAHIEIKYPRGQGAARVVRRAALAIAMRRLKKKPKSLCKRTRKENVSL